MSEPRACRGRLCPRHPALRESRPQACISRGATGCYSTRPRLPRVAGFSPCGYTVGNMGFERPIRRRRQLPEACAPDRRCADHRGHGGGRRRGLSECRRGEAVPLDGGADPVASANFGAERGGGQEHGVGQVVVRYQMKMSTQVTETGLEGPVTPAQSKDYEARCARSSGCT